MTTSADNSVVPAVSPTAAADSSVIEPWFTWNFEHRLDPQKRVQFPAVWRTSEAMSRFMLILWPHPHLKGQREFAFIKGILPSKFRSLVEQMASRPVGDDDASATRRRLFSTSLQIDLDPAGRLCLPPRMASEVGLAKDVLFVGNGDHFELWNKEIFEQCSLADKEVAIGAYKSLK